MSKFSSKRFFRRIGLQVFLIPIFGVAVWTAIQIHDFSREKTKIKSDFSEVNNIQHGLLSVDAWRDNITAILTDQIDEFKLTGMQQDTLRLQITKILNALISQADSMINEKQSNVGGKLKKFAFRTFINVDNIRKRVPEFSQTILNEINKPRAKAKLKYLAKDKLQELAEETRDSVVQESDLDNIMLRYGTNQVKQFNQVTLERIDRLRTLIYIYAFILIGAMLLYLIIWRIIRKQADLYNVMFTMSVLLAFVVLFIGLTAPMIEIDARIKEMNFLLVGHDIVFEDQVLFFQSKSIIDVVSILMQTGKPDSVFVGFLILLFSVIFPITKLLATKLYLSGKEKWKENKLLKYFAFKSGKWSMADVMVVAIFMAYIGFKGILDNQLSNITFKTSTIGSIATNETSLQPGFILFVAYVIFGLILSEILKRITSYNTKAVPVTSDK